MNKLMRFTAFLLLCFSFVGCNTTKKKVIRKEKVEKISKEINPDAYFKIIGTEPFWNIEISEDKIVFMPLNGDKIEFPYNIPANVKGTDNIVYSTVNGKGTIKIQLAKGNCSNAMSNKNYDYSAEVEIVQMKKITKLKGCGSYIENDVFSGKWILSQLKSKNILNNQNTILPFLEFDSENKHISGNAGCNGISSSFVLKGNKISFSEILLTRMFCEDLALEQSFVTTLGEITSYKIKENTLSLYKNNTLEMVFIKDKNL